MKYSLKYHVYGLKWNNKRSGILCWYSGVGFVRAFILKTTMAKNFVYFKILFFQQKHQNIKELVFALHDSREPIGIQFISEIVAFPFKMFCH